MSRQPILTNYVSEIDQFLQEFDAQHPIPTASQKKEQEKHYRIYRLRDSAVATISSDNSKLWEGF